MTTTNRWLRLFIAALASSFVLGGFMPSETAAQADRYVVRRGPAVRVSVSGVNATVVRAITRVVQESRYSSGKLATGSEWDIRFANGREAGEVILERAPGTTATVFMAAELTESKIDEVIRREYLWKSLEKLENLTGKSNISLELRARPLTDVNAGDGGRECSWREGTGGLKQGEPFMFEYRNTGKAAGFVYIFSLDADGDVKVLFQPEGEVRQAKPSEGWIPTATKGSCSGLFIVPESAAAGREVYKAIITPKPLSETAILGLGGVSTRHFELATVHNGEFIEEVNWGTASIEFRIGDSLPTLYSISVMSRQTDEDPIAAIASSTPSRSVPNRISNPTTVKQIQSAFEQVIERSQPHDTFVFYYDGIVEGGEEGAPAMPTDTFGIPLTYLQVWLEKIRARNRLLILDNQIDSARMATISSRLIETKRSQSGKSTALWSLSTREASPEMNGLLGRSLKAAIASEADANSDGSVSAFEIEPGLSRGVLRSSSGKVRLSATIQGDDFLVGKLKTEEPAQPLRSEVLTIAKSDSASGKKLGRSYALLFATDTYENYPALKNPINDAEDLGKALADNYGFTVDIRRNLKLDQIWDTFTEYQERKFEPNDQLLIFFAGHGVYKPPPVDLGYIIASDSKRAGSPERIFFSFSELAQQINRIQNNHILLVLDVCHGGTFGIMTRSGQQDEYGEIAPDVHIARTIDLRTRRYITSGGNEYVSDGRSRNSPFAYRLLTTLNDPSPERRDGLLTYFEVFNRVRLTPNQTPHSGDFEGNKPGSDFYFQVRATPR